MKRLDDVVAVGPGVGPGEVGLEAVGFGEARHVEPMAGPFLAEPGRGEQPVDRRRVGAVRRVGDEGRDFRGRGRQAGEVKGGAAKQGARFGGVRSPQTFRSESGLDEVVDAGAGGRSADGLISPVIEPRVPERGAVGGVLRPDGTFGDPLPELRHLRGRKRVALRGHLLVFVGGGHPLDERGLGGIAGDERRAGFAAFEGVRAGIEAQVRLRLLRPVTFHAALLQQGADLGVEIHGRARAHGGEPKAAEEDGGAGHGVGALKAVRRPFQAACPSGSGCAPPADLALLQQAFELPDDFRAFQTEIATFAGVVPQVVQLSRGRRGALGEGVAGELTLSVAVPPEP